MPKLRIEVFEDGAPSATITIPSWLMVAASKMLPRMAGKSLQDRIDLEQLERSLVVQALERSGWNQTRAATLLGVNRDQIRYRIEKFGLAAH